MVSVREARENDARRVVQMTHAVSEHEGSPPPNFSEDDYLRCGFGPARSFECFVAEVNGSLVGHIAITRGYDFQEGAPIVWVADLYVEPTYRRQGIARRLFGAVCTAAYENGSEFVQWMVAPDNDAANLFYRSLGAKDDGGRSMFLDGQCVKTLAAESVER